MKSSRFLMGSALMCSTTPLTMPAFAQTVAASATTTAATTTAATTTATTSTATEAGGIEEIVVTARKREENLQNIPVAETVVSGAEIDKLKINSIESVADLAPQLIIGRTGSGNGAAIGFRGISVDATSISLEQSVAVIIDGVYYSGGRALDFGLFDMQQIELLKGPQALFFGKNATAGALSFSSAAPTKTFEVMSRVGYEFYGQNPYVEGYVSGPLSDTLSYRLAYRYSDQTADLIKNNSQATSTDTRDITTHVNTPHTYAAAEDQGERVGTVRGTLQYESDFGLVASLKTTYSNYWAPGPNFHSVIANCPTGTIQTDPSTPCGHNFQNVQGAVPEDIAAVTPYTNGHNGRPYFALDMYGATLNLKYDIDNITLNLTPAYWKYVDEWTGDFDFTDGYLTRSPAIGGSGGNNPGTREEQDAGSIEARAQTHYSFPLNAMVGGYYQGSGQNFQQWNLFPGGVQNLAAPQGDEYASVQKIGHTGSKTEAAFFQLIWDITSQLSFNVGGRYTHESKDSFLDQPYVVPTALASFAVRDIGANQTFNNRSPEATITYKPVADVTIYGSFKEGYKSGGFSISGTISPSTKPTDPAFGPETVHGFEAGIKSVLFDHQVRLNFDAFRYDYNGIQADYLNPLTIQYFTLNAGSSRTEGAEVDAEYSPYAVRGLKLSGSVGYTDATYTSFPLAPCVGGQSVIEGCNLDPTKKGVYTLQSLSGMQLPQAPKFSGTTGVDYAIPVGTSTIDFSILGRYSARYKIYAFAPDSATRFYQSSYAAFDGTIRLQKDAWEVALIGKNLTNQFIETAGQALAYTGTGTGTATAVHSDTQASVEIPRTVAIEGTYRFK